MMMAQKNNGYTLIELILVIIIIGIMASIAVQKLGSVSENIRVEQTMKEMEILARAIVGNEALRNNGTPSDFGYIGDVGNLPPNLDALVANPGYSTWNGPYINNSFEQISSDYKTDEWQAAYQYSGGPQIISTGSGSNIVRQLAASTDELLYNHVSGTVFDINGTPPGDSLSSFLNIILTFPDGLGSYTNLSASPDEGGFFQFDSIPIGNHFLRIVYTPTNDTLQQLVTVVKNSDIYGEYFLGSDEW